MIPSLDFPHLFSPHGVAAESRGTIIVCYGTTRKKDMHLALKPFADLLCRLGFDVMTFDYRGNTQETRIEDFGISTRIEDVAGIIQIARVLGNPPISLLGFGMGAHIAVRAASLIQPDIPIENLLLISPTAYHYSLSASAMRFGQKFNDIVHDARHCPWTQSEVFALLEKLPANVLVVKYAADGKVRKHVADTYHASTKQSGTAYRQKLVQLHGQHDGALTRPSTSVHSIIKEIEQFLAGR